jgi:hypothetical protein
MRRCTHFVLAIFLLVDLVGSFLWGNAIASQISFSLGIFNMFLDNQITSCIMSQAVIALHFLFVSCRSRRGRGWAYASLRFELDECGQAFLLKQRTEKYAKHHQMRASFVEPILDKEESYASCQNVRRAKLSCFFHLRQRWLLFQQQNSSRCRMFVIPCVCIDEAGASSGSFAISRRAFHLAFLKPLQQLADAHPQYYFRFFFCFLAIPNSACLLLLRGLSRGISILTLTTCIFFMHLGFISSKCNGLDREAVKHITCSFRFVTCVVLLSQWILLDVRNSYLEGPDAAAATQSAATVAVAFVFLECTLLDCSPHLSASNQILISVTMFFQAYSFFIAHVSHSLRGGRYSGFWPLIRFEVRSQAILIALCSSEPFEYAVLRSSFQFTQVFSCL